MTAPTSLLWYATKLMAFTNAIRQWKVARLERDLEKLAVLADGVDPLVWPEEYLELQNDRERLFRRRRELLTKVMK